MTGIIISRFTDGEKIDKFFRHFLMKQMISLVKNHFPVSESINHSSLSLYNTSTILIL